MEEKDEALKKLRTELEEGFQRSLALAQSQWQGEKEADMKQHAESEVAKANAFWEKELKEVMLSPQSCIVSYALMHMGGLLISRRIEWLLILI